MKIIGLLLIAVLVKFVGADGEVIKFSKDTSEYDKQMMMWGKDGCSFYSNGNVICVGYKEEVG